MLNPSCNSMNWVLSQVCLALQTIFFHSTVCQHQTSALARTMIRSRGRCKPLSLINLFPLILSVMFSVLSWTLGLFEQCVYFQGVFQLSIKMTCQASLLCQLLDTLAASLLPGRSFSSCWCLPFSSGFLTWLWQLCAPLYFFSVFYFPLHQTQFHESISQCAQ